MAGKERIASCSPYRKDGFAAKIQVPIRNRTLTRKNRMGEFRPERLSFQEIGPYDPLCPDDRIMMQRPSAGKPFGIKSEIERTHEWVRIELAFPNLLREPQRLISPGKGR